VKNAAAMRLMWWRFVSVIRDEYALIERQNVFLQRERDCPDSSRSMGRRSS
jgi:hypothetical protein